MHIDTRSLSAEHGMRHVRGSITVAVTDGVDARQTGAHARVVCRIDLVIHHDQAQFLGQSGTLGGRVVCDEGVAYNAGAIGEMDPEDVVLSTRVVAVVISILETLNGCNGAVVNTDIPRFELLLPVRVLGCQGDFVGGRVGAVSESDDVRVQGVGFHDAADHVRQPA